MQSWFRQSWSLLTATTLCVGIAGCAAQSGDSLRLSEELGRARAEAGRQEARAAELESRLSRLEQRAGSVQSAERAQDRELMNRLVRMMELNERLLAERVPAGSGAPNGGTGRVAASALTSARPSRATGAPVQTEEQELRALVERLRGRPGSPHGGLTREQENALRVLTRPERTLDTENPWATAFY